MELIAGVGALVVALYLPGFLFFRALRFGDIPALIAAPLFSAALYGVLPLAYYKAGIPCTPASTFGVALVLGAAAFGLSWLLGLRGKATLALPQPAGTWRNPRSPRGLAADWGLLALYLACGVAICGLVYAASLSQPDAIYVRYDNQTHLNVSKAFLDSGMWSSLHPNRYLDLPLESRAIVTGGASFYPALLYVLVALDALMAGLSVGAALNAVMIGLAAVVFPLGMFGIMRVLFPENRLAVALGALTAVAFTGFPWGLYVRALFPNAAGFCLLAPALGATLIAWEGQALRAAVGRAVALWALALPALALAQPNAIFAAFVFLMAYLAHDMGKRAAAGSSLPGGTRTRRWIAIACVFAAGALVWALCMNLPFLHSVVRYFGNTITSPLLIFRKTLLLAFAPFRAEILLGLVGLVGVAVCLCRRLLWPLFPLAWFAAAYFVVRTQNNLLTHILGGFWYTDHVRLAALYSIYLAPVAAAGLAWLAQTAGKLLEKHRPQASALLKPTAGVAVVAVFALVNFCPNISVPGKSTQLDTGFGSVYATMADMYAYTEKHVYTQAEYDFVEQVRELVGDDMVVNYPQDGSVFAYSANNLNIYYRGTKFKHITPESKLIRLQLANYAKKPKVKAALETVGAKYVLKLDHNVAYEDGIWFNQFNNPESWKGIEAVDDDTPGFTVVLAEDDMRLYRIG